MLLLLALLRVFSVALLAALEVSSSLQILAQPHTLIYFYAPDCKFCQAFDPQYEYLAALYGGNPNFQAVKINGRTNKDLVDLFGVKFFPTLKFYDDVEKQVLTFNGPRTMALIEEFISENSGATPEPENVAQNVKVISSVAEADSLRTPAIIAFVTKLHDWAPYYFPTHFYQRLAREFPHIEFALVFTDQGGSELMQQYHVSNMPSLVYRGEELIGVFNTLSTNQMVNYELSEEKVRLFLENPGIGGDGQWFENVQALSEYADTLEFSGHMQWKSGMNVVESRRQDETDLDGQYRELVEGIQI